MLAVVAMGFVGCAGDDADRGPPAKGGPVATGTGETGVETGTGDTADPSTPTCPVPEPREPCADARLTGSWSLNAGWSLWMGDLDRDGAAELLAGEIRSNSAPYASRSPEERVVLLEPPFATGRLGDVGRVLVESAAGPVPWTDESDRGVTSTGKLGDGVAWSDATDELLVSAATLGDTLDIGSFPLVAGTTQRPADAVGVILGTNGEIAVGKAIGVSSSFAGRPALWSM